jgi:hypothetical protein
MAIHMRKVLGGAQPRRALARSGGLPGRRSSPQQTTDFHRTMAKVCKSGGEGTFAEKHGNGEVAPIPAVRRTTIEPPESTLSRPS